MNQDRKSDHIRMALGAQGALNKHDDRFIYEPLLSAHPQPSDDEGFQFLGKTMRFPLWISSMTGGTVAAHRINQNLARVCRCFGLGMGLGSCRYILTDRTRWSDFDWRDMIGDERPFYANLGIAQVEQLLEKEQYEIIEDLVGNLRADGLIVHVNPLQEWFQPEGDRIHKSPVETLERLLNQATFPLIVKEVGQGMGPESLKQLLQLPLAAIEFAAFGGTNFSRLELSRSAEKEMFSPFVQIGQTPLQMIHDVNREVAENPKIKCRQLIVSGGIKTALDGYFYTEMSDLPAIFGMASTLLRPAAESYEALKRVVQKQLEMYLLAKSFLKINPEYEK